MRRTKQSGSSGLSLYMEQIGRCPMLTRDQESELVARWGGVSSNPLRQELVRAHLRLVVRTAREFQGRGLPFEDLIAEGNVGLLRAARRFNLNRGVRFITCAVWWIRKSMLEALERNRCLVRIPDHRLRDMREAMAESHRISGQPGRRKGTHDCSSQQRLTSAEVEQLLSLRRPPVRLDPGEGHGEQGRLLDTLADYRSPDPEETLQRKETTARVHGAMRHLSPRQQQVVRQRFGLMDGTPRTLEETGRTLGVSRERARQVERRAMEKLHRLLSLEKVSSRLAR